MQAGFLHAVFTGKHCEKEYATGEIPVWHIVTRGLTLMILDAMHRFHLKYRRHKDSIGETSIRSDPHSLAIPAGLAFCRQPDRIYQNL